MFDITPHLQFLNPKASTDEPPFEALNFFGNRIRKEKDPDDPPQSLEETITRWRSIPPLFDVYIWVVWSSNKAEIIATADVGFMGAEVEHNQHLAQFEISVIPSMRRQGIAKQLLKQIAEVVDANEKRLLIINTDSAIAAGEIFVKRLGAQMALTGHTNQLDLADIDLDLMKTWQRRAQERASDFELGIWEGPYPEEDIQVILDMKAVMNTAPRDDLDVEDMTWTVEQLRQLEESTLKQGRERWTMYARHRETGEIAGYTEVYWNPHQPKRLGQGDTAVFPQHRNAGIGRWLKAAMVEKVLRDRPEVECIRTGNASSNGAMLKVNHEMGFKLYKTESVWQAELEAVKQYLQNSDRA